MRRLRDGIDAMAPDADERLNLAVAYREMGLYDDAVREAAAALATTHSRTTAGSALEMFVPR